ncbi:hypothetical protein RFI_10086 [Reticulomyxa filosa]|uniref:C2 domain-containing protein n=1 Tax=Reticulomyxa filosa TaxID=46433 RepID=X6NMX3_RETFI|nr:hypothetical protein RFI_10086 [Reticulomyxa filosa]|eukprot:ETO27044.1 hypothetical protein RFI_10086 [Reticulomyxa filosa]
MYTYVRRAREKKYFEENGTNDLLQDSQMSPESLVYVLEIYQGRNLPRQEPHSEVPNVYVKAQFVSLRSNRPYRTDIVYQSCDPIFHANFLEVDVQQIILTVCHRNTTSNLPDQIIGYVPISIQNFTEYDEFIWVPIVSSVATKKYFGENLLHDQDRYAGHLQIRLSMISLDEALAQKDRKQPTRYSHVLAIQLKHFCGASNDRNGKSKSEEKESETKSNEKKVFNYPVAQIEWKYDELYTSRYATQCRNQPGLFSWNEWHFLFINANGDLDDRPSNLRFTLIDDEMRSINDTIGHCQIDWKDLIQLSPAKKQTFQLHVHEKPLISPLWITEPVNPRFDEKKQKAVSDLVDFMKPYDDYNTNPLANVLLPFEPLTLLPRSGRGTVTSLSFTFDDLRKDSLQHINSDDLEWYDSSRKQALLGTFTVEVQLLQRKDVEKQFYTTYVSTYLSQEQLQNSIGTNSHTQSLSGSTVYEMMLCLGIHPSDQEFETLLAACSSDRHKMATIVEQGCDESEEKKENPAEQTSRIKIERAQCAKPEMEEIWDGVYMDSKTVMKVLTEHQFETSTPLTYYLYTFLKVQYQHSNRINVCFNEENFVIGSCKREDSILQCDVLEAGWWVRFFTLPLYDFRKDESFVLDRYFIFSAQKKKMLRQVDYEKIIYTYTHT